MFSCSFTFYLQPWLPNLCFLDVPNGLEKYGSGGSFYNEQEAQVVAKLIEILLYYDIEPRSIGVITLYKSQMYQVIQLLHGNRYNLVGYLVVIVGGNFFVDFLHKEVLDWGR